MGRENLGQTLVVAPMMDSAHGPLELSRRPGTEEFLDWCHKKRYLMTFTCGIIGL